MWLKIPFFIILLVAFSTIFAANEKTDDEYIQQFRTKHAYHLKYIFLFGGILVVIFIRHISIAYEIAVPYNVFCIFVGVLWGIGSVHSRWMRDLASMTETLVKNITSIYIPAMIFSIGFCIDLHAFAKTLSQICIISIPAAFLSAMANGLLMRLVIDPNWRLEDAILFGSLLCASYPSRVMRWFMGLDFHGKTVRILLEGEAILTASVGLIVYTCTVSYHSGWVIWWYQFAAMVIRAFCFGIPLSYLYGFLGASLMRLAYNDAVGLMFLTITMCYTTYYFMRWLVNGGVVGTTTVAIVMGFERASLPKEMEKMLISMWELINIIISGVLFINIGVMMPLVMSGYSFNEYILVIVTYLVTNITRFLSYFLFYPLLSRIGYGMSLQNMIICVWTGMKNPICLNLALKLLDETYKNDLKKGKIFFLHTVGVYILLSLINGSCIPFLLKTLGLSQISLSRQVNMNNCMKFIYEARTRTIALLKMDRFLADANWPLVMKFTSLKHPFKENMEVKGDQEEENEYFLGSKYTFCPDCQKNVPNEPTPKEMQDMTREARLRILKLKKTAYSRQYENRMMSKNAIRILHHAVDTAIDSDELLIDFEDLFKLFVKEGIFYRFLRNIFRYFLRTTDEEYKLPRKPWRRTCYSIVNHSAFYAFINITVIAHIIIIIFHISYVYHIDWVSYYVLNNIYNFFFCIYLIEFWLKIFALSWIYIWSDGFYNYFRSYWNIFEFTILIVTSTASLIHILWGYVPPIFLPIIDWILLLLLIIRIQRLLRLLKMCDCCHTLIPTIIKYLEAKIDRHRILAYELGKNYITAGEDIMKNLDEIIDNAVIREDVRQRCNKERLEVWKKLGHAQYDWPSVATTVKTKIAMNTILNSMREDIHELKISGWVDDGEYSKLLKSLNERHKYVQSIKMIQPLSPKMLFREIEYMGDDDQLIDFLYANVTTKKFDPGDVVVKDGETLEGICILIKGMFAVHYNTSPEVVERLRKMGALPIIDIVTGLDFDKPMHEYKMPGNSIGEFSFLTGRSYNGMIIAETSCQVFILNRNILKMAFEKDEDPVQGFECRIWKHVGVRRAMHVMKTAPLYRSYTHEKIKFILERSFVPDLSNYKVFVVSDMVEDIILIEGMIVDFNTREVYIGPCYVPRAVQKLVLQRSSLFNVEITFETKLLIIPAKDYDEYQIMLTEEDTCELVNDQSTKCLRHLIQDKAFFGAKSSQVGRIRNVLTEIRKRMTSVGSSKSKISFVSTAH